MQERPVHGVYGIAAACFASDLDEDGDLDALSASPDDDKVAWYEAQGDGAGTACDCAPQDATVLPPPPVDSLAFDKVLGQSRLSWSAVAGADSYQVTRGKLSQLSVGQYGECLQTGIANTQFLDWENPPSGDGFGYLVAGESDQCGSGSLGLHTFGVRVNNDPDACP